MAFNLSDYVTGAESIEPSDFNGPEDGTYEFEITDIYPKEGSQANPDAVWIFVEYQLDSGRKYNELFTMPKDPARPTENERQAVGRYLSRLISLGVERSEVNRVNTDTLVGKTGTLTLRTTTNRKNQREYQNISKLVLHEGAQQAATPVGLGAPRQATMGTTVVPATARQNPFAPSAE
jgi:hypothetical protein